jgi:hypothetical protein
MMTGTVPVEERKGAACARRRRAAGFTLVELMVATAVGVTLTLVTMMITFRQRTFHEAHRATNEIRQNTSYILQNVARDLRMAGYGLEVPDSELASWISWETSFTQNPKIVNGTDGSPDALSIAAAFDRPVAELISGITEGATVMSVRLLVPDNFAPFDQPQNRVVYLGKVETMRITGSSGTGENMTLQISAAPTSIQGVRYDYPAGTPVELVKVVTYQWVDDDQSTTGYPYINRWDTATINQSGWWEVSAPYIEDFQVTPSGDGFLVSVTGMAATSDNHYTHPTRGDGYRRWTLAASVHPRN